MKYKLAIFDLDGTLLDTLEDLKNSVNHSLSVFGYEERSQDEIKSFVGNGVRRLVERALPDTSCQQDADMVFDEFRRYYSVHCSDFTKPYDGIIELLTKLSGLGMKIAVVSNKTDPEVKKLTHGYFGKLVDAAIGEREGIRRKPYSDSVNELLLTLGINRSDAVYIGDSEVDIETARNAQMDMIAVSWGFRSEEMLIKAGAKKVARNADTLGEMLSNI